MVAPAFDHPTQPMKVALVGISNIKAGKHNLKEPRLEEANRLVKADKLVYAQADVVDQSGLLDADAVLASQDGRLELILMDLEFIETRLGRNPSDVERAALEKIKAALESDQLASSVTLTNDEKQALTAHALMTNKPITVGSSAELADPDALLLRCVHEAGCMFFLTVGGKENRSWIIRRGLTAWEAAGSIHTDIQKGFIRAEVIGWDDFVAGGGETGAKRAGKQRLEQKAYVMQDCDVVNFRCNK
jgi:ribosome-binding ATPase YchF (GTP1/OBG family)